MRLLYYANGARYKVNGEWVFRKWFAVPSKDLYKDLGVSQHTLCKFRDELAKANYIRYKSGVGSGRTEYMLCPLNGAQKPTAKPTEAYQSLPKPTEAYQARSAYTRVFQHGRLLGTGRSEEFRG